MALVKLITLRMHLLVFDFRRTRVPGLCNKKARECVERLEFLDEEVDGLMHVFDVFHGSPGVVRIPSLLSGMSRDDELS